jgi:hypothetical protein
LGKECLEAVENTVLTRGQDVQEASGIAEVLVVAIYGEGFSVCGREGEDSADADECRGDKANVHGFPLQNCWCLRES